MLSTKRPLEGNDDGNDGNDGNDDEGSATKKHKNNDLEVMQATLVGLLKSADDHQEQARIAVVDLAYDIEEQLKEVQQHGRDLDTKICISESECNTANEYLDRARNSTTVQMLKNAAKISDEHFGSVFVEDNRKIAKGLSELETLKHGLEDKRDCLKEERSSTLQNIDNLKRDLALAEKRVACITNLTEFGEELDDQGRSVCKFN
jgi:hypothetical protein